MMWRRITASNEGKLPKIARKSAWISNNCFMWKTSYLPCFNFHVEPKGYIILWNPDVTWPHGEVRYQKLPKVIKHFMVVSDVPGGGCIFALFGEITQVRNICFYMSGSGTNPIARLWVTSRDIPATGGSAILESHQGRRDVQQTPVSNGQKRWCQGAGGRIVVFGGRWNVLKPIASNITPETQLHERERWTLQRGIRFGHHLCEAQSEPRTPEKALQKPHRCPCQILFLKRCLMRRFQMTDRWFWPIVAVILNNTTKLERSSMKIHGDIRDQVIRLRGRIPWRERSRKWPPSSRLPGVGMAWRVERGKRNYGVRVLFLKWSVRG